MADARPYFLTPEVERVLIVAMTIAQELAVARTRIDTLERVLERKGLLQRSDIEGFEPDNSQQGERDAWMQEYVARVLRVLDSDAG